MANISDDEVEIDDTNKPQRGDWSFTIDGNEYHWLSVEPHILPETMDDSAKQVISSIYGVLDEIANDSGRIAISPVGPFLAPDVSDAEAVYYVISQLYPQATFYGDAPDAVDLGIDDGQDNDPVIN